ncbi:hypothetical protein ACIBJD_33740 [Kitasatospora sp. NPDC050467]|uniref:hypothetical protein n=1 Tax=Kitasatospora sp. NPDC050467 TaxID=3364053 RepID=UPI0037A73B63
MAHLPPCGTGTLHITAHPADGEIAAAAWGTATEWLVHRLPTLLGADDTPDRLVLPPGTLREAQRRNPGRASEPPAWSWTP